MKHWLKLVNDTKKRIVATEVPKYATFQGFIQVVLLMSVFEQRLSFRMFYFMTNDHEVIVKCRWGSGGAVSFAAGS